MIKIVTRSNSLYFNGIGLSGYKITTKPSRFVFNKMVYLLTRNKVPNH